MGTCPCIDNSLVCIATYTKQDCDNMMVVKEARKIDYEIAEDNEQWNTIDLLVFFRLAFLILSDFP